MGRKRLRRLPIGLLGVLVGLGSVVGLLALPAPAAAIGPTVTGAGSTWVQIALDQWRADIARQGYNINYQGVGSSSGRTLYIINEVDFAASEIPFQPDELAQLAGEHKHWQYLPDVAGGTSLMYNLHTPAGSRITNLRLDGDSAAKLFTGRITSWHDPEIAALNPGLQIAEDRVEAVIRSDGSGTSAQFSLYLADQAPGVWGPFASSNGCPAPCSLWPGFGDSVNQTGSDGVANFVANDAVGTGAIGYVEAGYAYGRQFPIAYLRNASGNFVPGVNDPRQAPVTFSKDVATALTHATLNADLTQNLAGVYRAPEANAYPMSSYSYMIAPTTDSPFDPAKGMVLGTWIIYIACGGQREATPLGYSPLPPNLIQADMAAVNRIPGHPPTPPIDYAHCPNPTLSANAAAASRAGPSIAGHRSALAGTAGPQAGAATGPLSAGLPPSALLAQAPTSEDLFGLIRVTLADAGQRQRLLDGAVAAASRLKTGPDTPLLATAVIIALLVFGPILIATLRGREGDG